MSSIEGIVLSLKDLVDMRVIKDFAFTDEAIVKTMVRLFPDSEYIKSLDLSKDYNQLVRLLKLDSDLELRISQLETMKLYDFGEIAYGFLYARLYEGISEKFTCVVDSNSNCYIRFKCENDSVIFNVKGVCHKSDVSELVAEERIGYNTSCFEGFKVDSSLSGYEKVINDFCSSIKDFIGDI